MPQNLNPFEPPKSNLNQKAARIGLGNFSLGLLAGGAVAFVLHSILELQDSVWLNYTPPYFALLFIGAMFGVLAGLALPKSNKFAQICIIIWVFSVLWGFLLPAFQSERQQF